MSQSADTETLQFYQQQAEVYSQRIGQKISPALPGFLGRLRPGASILEFANFKEGAGEGRDRFGRFYNYPSLAVLRDIFQQAAPWFALEIERSSGKGYDGTAVQWLNCSATKNEKG
jgi:hypothetical protein